MNEITHQEHELGFQERFRDVVQEAGGVQTSASVMGKGMPQIYRYLRGENSPPISTIGRLASRLGISLSWLVNNEGPKYLANLGSNEQTTAPTEFGDGFICFEIQNDSMEPAFKSGDRVIINPSQAVFKDGVFLLEINNERVIRRVALTLDGFLIQPDNRNYPSIPINKNEATKIKVLGQVTWHCSRT